MQNVPKMKLPADPESKRVLNVKYTKAVSVTVVVRGLLLTEGEKTVQNSPLVVEDERDMWI